MATRMRMAFVRGGASPVPRSEDGAGTRGLAGPGSVPAGPGGGGGNAAGPARMPGPPGQPLDRAGAVGEILRYANGEGPRSGTPASGPRRQFDPQEGKGTRYDRPVVLFAGRPDPA